MRALCLLLGLMMAAAPAWGATEELYLNRPEPWVSYNTLGWSFLGLTVVSLAVTANRYQESQEALEGARDAYDEYQAAQTEAEALKWRDKTERLHDRAENYEVAANTALFLTVLFGLTSYYSFNPEDEPSVPPLSVSARGLRLSLRF